MGDEELVSVVIPAYNAEGTLDETLRSVRSQTHQALEIVVVDDGSTDGTARIAEIHARDDPRVRLIPQANAGVAAARNRGIAETSGPYVAPVDADDLWAPRKIERQLQAMRRGGESVGLVYTWYALIDEHGRILQRDTRRNAEGDVIEALCSRNIVGNGSSALMRREAVIAAGGYDPGLRAQGAQGCEDYKLYFAIAERYRFGLVREHLTGYRELPSNMSSDLWRMLRSRDLCAFEIAERHPRLHVRLRRGRTRLLRFMLTRSVRTRRWRDVRRLLREMLSTDPGGATLQLVELFMNAGRKLAGRERGGPDRERLFLVEGARPDGAR